MQNRQMTNDEIEMSNAEAKPKSNILNPQSLAPSL